MNPTTSTRDNSKSWSQIKLVIGLSAILLAVIVFRWMSASPGPVSIDSNSTQENLATTINTPLTLASNMTKSTVTQTTPISIDLNQLWTGNPFRRIENTSDQEMDSVALTVEKPNFNALPAEESRDKLVSRISEHRVSAIYRNGPERIAILDGKVVRAGDMIGDDLRVAAIHTDRIEVTRAEPSLENN